MSASWRSACAPRSAPRWRRGARRKPLSPEAEAARRPLPVAFLLGCGGDEDDAPEREEGEP